MLPASYHLPAAVVLLLGGGIACFFGHRLFRLVLAIFGFMLGAVAGQSLFGGTSTMSSLIAVVVGGLAGAGLLTAVYFVGVALVGAGLGAVIAHLIFVARAQDPTVLMVVLLSVAGAVLAMYLERYVVVVATGFGGAWTLIVGGLALAGDSAAMAAAAGGRFWAILPFEPVPGHAWVRVVWIVLGVMGVAAQLGWTAGSKGRVGRRKKKK